MAEGLTDAFFIPSWALGAPSFDGLYLYHGPIPYAKSYLQSAGFYDAKVLVRFS